MGKKIMSFLLAVLLTATLLPVSTITANAASSGFTIENGVLTKYTGPGGHVVIPDGVKTVGGFSNCTSLLSVTFPDSVTSIRSSAFSGCSALKEIVLPAGVTSIGSSAFQDCKNLGKINIPSGVTRIETSTFENCLNLKEIVLPAGVTRIGDNAFCQCTSLARINIPSGVTGIGSWAFCECYALTQITLPDGLTGIGTKAFAYSGLTEIAIPGSVRTDGRSYDSVCAFEGCRSLMKAIIREGVTAIASNEFWNCTKLTTVYIPQSVTKIGEISITSIGGASHTTESGAFTGATALTDVHYAGTQAQWKQITIARPKYADPAKVYPLDSAAIHYNSAAPAGPSTPTGPGTEPSTPDAPTTATTQAKDASGNAFRFTLDTASNTWILTGFTSGFNPKTVTVPDTVEGKPVKAIGSLAFAAQTAIETVHLPDAVISIGNRAFYNCWALKTVNIPKSIERIEYCAFENCRLLQNVEFPTTLTTIETRAFFNCASLTRVDIPDSVVNFGTKTLDPENWGMSGQVFEGCTSLKDLSLGLGVSDFWRAFAGAAVETAVVPRTVNDSLNTQSTINRYAYQTYQSYKDCKELKTAYVESGVHELVSTFSGCTKLEAMYLPKSVTSLNGAFNSITGGDTGHHLDLYYEGNQAEFDKIKLTSMYCSTDALGKERTASQKIDEINEKKPHGLTVTVHYSAYTPVNFSASYTHAALAAADALHDLGLFNGVGNDPSGNPLYALDRAPTRYEAVTMLVRLLGKENEANAQQWSTPFTDVVDWARPYVGYAYANGLTNGVAATRFDGNNTATKEQYGTFILRALGYTSGVDFQWNAPWNLLAKTGVMLSDSNYWLVWRGKTDSDFYREDVVLMSFLSLSAKIKGTNTTLIDQILDEGGVHTHSYKTYILPAAGSYQRVPVEQKKVYAIEYHCNACSYTTYDYNDINVHQESYCFPSGTTYPGTDTVNRPWYSYTRRWKETRPGVMLNLCTVCGMAG